MIFKNLSIRNVGRFRHTDIDFTGRNFIAITGANETGKSYVVGCIVAALWGEFPGKSPQLHDHITWGESSAEIHLDLEFLGKEYRVSRMFRKTEKTKSHDAIIFEKTIDKETGNSSYVNLTGGNKVSVTDSIIRETFGRKETYLASGFASQGGVGDIISCDRTERYKIMAEFLRVNHLFEISKFAEMEISRIDRVIEEANSGIANYREMQRNLDMMESNRSDNLLTAKKLEESIPNVKKKIDSLIMSIGEEEVRCEQLEEAIKTEAAGEATYEKMKAAENLWKASVNEESRCIESISNIGDVEERAKKLEELESKLAALLVQDKKNTEYETLKREYDGLKRECDHLEETASGIKTLPDPDGICKDCSLTRVAYRAKDKCITVKEEISAVKEKARVIVTDPEVSAKISEIKAKIRSLGSPDSDKKLLLQSKKRLGELEVVKRDRKIELDSFGQFTYDPVIIRGLRDNIKVTRDRIKDLNTALSNEKSSLSGIISRLDEVKKSIKKLDNGISQQSERISNASITNIDIKSLENRKYFLGKLKEIFSKKGFLPVLIDHYGPEITSICNDILQNIDVQEKISLITKSESGKEILDIKVDNDFGSADIEQYSGGKQKLLKTVLRLAISMWRSQKSNRIYKSIILDEAFEALDPQNFAKIVKTLKDSSLQIEQVIVVGHVDDQVIEIPARLLLTKERTNYPFGVTAEWL